MMKMPLFERIRMWWYGWIVRYLCHHKYNCCSVIFRDCRECAAEIEARIDSVIAWQGGRKNDGNSNGWPDFEGGGD